MPEVCPNCGLPKDLCVCETIAKEEEKLRVHTDRRRYGKVVTVIENVSKEMKPEELAKQLKQKLACGGTYKDGRIELQGDHMNKIRKILVSLGFPEESIEVVE